MNMIENALELSQAQARAASEAARAVSACFGALLQVSAAFARANAERNAAFGLALIGAKSVEGVAEIQGAFMRDSLRGYGAMATEVVEACSFAAKQCQEVAAQTMRGASDAAERT